MQRNKYKKNSGFADTVRYPHKGHPANYKWAGRDKIEYITFTHEPKVKLDNGKIVNTIRLNSNIHPKERAKLARKKKKDILETDYSHAYPKRYIGKRSALGKENYNYSFSQEDKLLVDKLFTELPVEYVQYSDKAYKKKRK